MYILKMGIDNEAVHNKGKKQSLFNAVIIFLCYKTDLFSS